LVSGLVRVGADTRGVFVVVLGLVLDWISRGSAWFADGVSRVPCLHSEFGNWDDATAEIKLFLFVPLIYSLN
jgi:hypothetical protein